jgi:hypothetical protein
VEYKIEASIIPIEYALDRDKYRPNTLYAMEAREGGEELVCSFDHHR